MGTGVVLIRVGAASAATPSFEVAAEDTERARGRGYRGPAARRTVRRRSIVLPS